MDGVGDSSTVRRILLGSTLRRLREGKGVSMREAGYHIRNTESKISRMETGKVSFKERDVQDLLTLYGVELGKERDRVLDLVREANTLGWWHAFSEVLPDWFEAFVGLEAAASVVRTYEVQFIPGLLQSPEYTSAIVSSNRSLTAQEVAGRVELRRRRQNVLDRPADPLVLWAVLDESALRRPVGGAEVMRRQVDLLIRHAARPNVTIQILPYSIGTHAAEGGAFTMLRYSEADLADVVYQEHLTSAQYIERPEEVEHFSRAMDRISVDALPPDITVSALERLLGRM